MPRVKLPRVMMALLVVGCRRRGIKAKREVSSCARACVQIQYDAEG